jgi:hypothetical protein
MALFLGAGDPQEKETVPDEVSARFMKAWGEWHVAHADAIVDSGSPLGANVRVTRDQTKPVGNQVVAWMLVESGSAEDAAAMFSRHPHVLLLPGNTVDVMELLPVPEG